MAKPIVGERYLFVTCKSCGKAFRVFDQPLRPDVERPPQPDTLQCRGCGHRAAYAPTEMMVGRVTPAKP